MTKSLLYTDKEIAEIYERHVNTIYHVCFSLLKNPVYTEDAVQNTFIKILTCKKNFESSEHEKAWLIVTATNICKNYLRHWWNKKQPIEYCEEYFSQKQPEIDETLDLVRSLPDKYKVVIYLFYYEGYSSVEIAQMLGKPQSTIRSYLNRGRDILRKKLGGDFDEE